MSATIFAAEWDGEQMIPLPRFRRECDKTFVIGERYVLETIEQRSAASHRHYFACIRSAWQNLPEDMSKQFPSEDHLRKYALVKTGYYNSNAIKCETPAQAVKLVAFLKPLDEFGVIDMSGLVVTRYTAKSQSMRSMGKDIFSKSKSDVLDFLAAMVGTTMKELTGSVPQ